VELKLADPAEEKAKDSMKPADARKQPGQPAGSPPARFSSWIVWALALYSVLITALFGVQAWKLRQGIGAQKAMRRNAERLQQRLEKEVAGAGVHAFQVPEVAGPPEDRFRRR
jgi:hypothetical protein